MSTQTVWQGHSEAELQKLTYRDKQYNAIFNGVILGLASDPKLGPKQTASRDAVDKLSKLLHKCPYINVDRVVEGGSFGRRTLVPGSFDVDLSVFVTSWRPDTEGKLHILDWENDWHDAKLQRRMRCKVGGWLDEHGYEWSVEVEEGSGYESALQLHLSGVELDVMLVPNLASGPGRKRTQSDDPNASGDSERCNALAQLKALAEPVYNDPRFSAADPTREAALSEPLIEFVKGTDDQVKSVVRLVKAWYKHSLEARRLVVGVPSVLLEVVVIAAQQQLSAAPVATDHPSGRVGPMLELLLLSLRLLEAAARGEEVVAVDAGKWGYRHKTALACRHVWGADTVRVLHPVDPTCNLAAPSRRKRRPDWAVLAAQAAALRRLIVKGSLWDLVGGPGSSLAPALRRLERLKAAGEEDAPLEAGGGNKPTSARAGGVVPFGQAARGPSAAGPGLEHWSWGGAGRREEWGSHQEEEAGASGGNALLGGLAALACGALAAGALGSAASFFAEERRRLRRRRQIEAAVWTVIAVIVVAAVAGGVMYNDGVLPSVKGAFGAVRQRLQLVAEAAGQLLTWLDRGNAWPWSG